MDYSHTYVDMMLTSLKEKVTILEELIALTKKQGEYIRGGKADTPAYDTVYEQKDRMIQALVDTDKGFEKMYQRVKEELDQNRDVYKNQILEMQKKIRTITDQSVQLQAMELRNKEAMEQYLKGERESIRQFYNNNKASSLYYQNMARHPHGEQSIFYDQKK
ncbi:MAG: hypothetical protein PUB10_08595 [Clostridiales bacterium]|nr:hypothetical protein [Clostridiales bacterium]